MISKGTSTSLLASTTPGLPTRRSALSRAVLLRCAAVLSCALLTACDSSSKSNINTKSKTQAVDAGVSQTGPQSVGNYYSGPVYTAHMGYFDTGAALVDINGDHLPDMLMSNGNDMAPQSLIVHYNDSKINQRFKAWPDWYSG